MHCLSRPIRLARLIWHPQVKGATRLFSSFPPLAAGHSKWDNIRHDKAKNDAVKGKQRELQASEITIASRLGGADPKINPRLADAIAKARKASLPKANIDAAIARGQGLSASGQKLEALIEEALLPSGVALIIEMLTDNKHAAKVDVRKTLKFHGASPSSIAYLFEKKGRISIAHHPDLTEDALLDAAVDAGALDIQQSADGWVVFTRIEDTASIAQSLQSDSIIAIQDSDIIWDAKDAIFIHDQQAMAALHDTIDKLRELQCVQEVYSNARSSQ